MEERLTIAVIAGTAREKRLSIHAARYVAEFGKKLSNVDIIFVDPKDFTFSGDGNYPEGKDARYTALTAQADAFFIITPEYNHSFPGSLKRMLDSEYENYVHKPVALAGASNRNWGGVRAIEALVGTVREMGLVVTRHDVYFPRLKELFDDSGVMRPDAVEGYDKNLTKAFDELIWMAQILKRGRKQADG